MRWPKFPIAFWLLFILSVQVRAAGPIVRSIEVEGGQKIEKAAIMARILTKVGQPLDPRQVADDIRSVFGLEYFDSVNVSEENVSGGVKLIFEVKEKPIISAIEFEGLGEFDEDDLKEDLQVKVYEVLNIHKLNETVERFAEKYEEKGYYLADIQYEVVPQPENQVKVIFRVNENDQIKVKNIEIIGNTVINDSEITGIMQTQEGSVFSFITGSGTYREAVFERDVAMIQMYYGTLGYVQARVSTPEVTVSPDKKWIEISIHVEEGKQFKVGNIEFQGDLLFTREELSEGLELIPGEIFNTDTLRRETLRLTEKYGDLGYAFANVVPQPAIHEDTQTVDIVFEVDKGRRVYIGNITVTGNTKTKDKVIRRELLIQEGELFNGTNKRLSRENVVRLGFFESVDFHQTTSKVDPEIVNIDIRVRERSTGQLVIGAGYASGNIGFTANAQLSQQNFLGNGQVASLSAQIMTGRNFYEFNLDFQEPYVGHSLWSLGGGIYHVRRVVTATQGVETFEEFKSGFNVKLGHPIMDFTNLYMTYVFERSDADKIIDKTHIPPSSVNGYKSSVSANLVTDKRDDRFDPRTGWFGSLTGELAGLGGDRRFYKFRGQFKFFRPIIWDFIFRFNFTGAGIRGWGGSSIPVNELFIQGGLFSLRGYPFLSIGPKVTLSSNSADLSDAAVAKSLMGTEVVIGGQNELLAQAEIEFPILKEARVRGVIFFDAGNSFNDLNSSRPTLYSNFGYGIRWFTPIGPLRFEFGHPLFGGQGTQFYFTIGPPF